jgi:hypothetical protein
MISAHFLQRKINSYILITCNHFYRQTIFTWLLVFLKFQVEIFQNKKLPIKCSFTTPKTILKRLNLEITTKLVQISNSDSIKINQKFQDVIV